jgi:hypothetical protein
MFIKDTWFDRIIDLAILATVATTVFASGLAVYGV